MVGRRANLGHWSPLVLSFIIWLSVLAGFSVGLKLWNVVLAFAGNTIGVWRALRGQHFATWNVSELACRIMPVTPADGRGS